MKNDSLNLPLFSSCLIHLVILLIGSALMQQQKLRRQDFLPIGLIDVPRAQTPPAVRKVESPPEIKKPLTPLPKAAKRSARNAIAGRFR